MKFSKNVNDRKCAPEMIFFNEKKIRKIPIILHFESQNFTKCPEPEVVRSSLYQKNIGVEFTHLYKSSLC